MIINITEDRRLSSDTNQFKLEKRCYDKKRDQFYWTSYKYYSNFDSAFSSIPEQLLKESDTNGYKACLDYLKEIKKLLEEIKSND